MPDKSTCYTIMLLLILGASTASAAEPSGSSDDNAYAGIGAGRQVSAGGTAPARITGADADARWAKVMSLSPETKIVIMMRGAQPVRTTFVRADQSSLWVRRMPAVANQQFERFDKSGVLEVLADRGMKAAPKGVIIGAASAVAIAAIGAAGVGEGSQDTKGGTFRFGVAVFAPVFIAIGAGVGALVDAGRGSNVIYRAP